MENEMGNAWEELIEIDRRFQTAVNLQFDWNNREKLEHYVVTSSAKRVYDTYLEYVEQGRVHATLLVGPYGKGKSHLLLMLLHALRERERPFLPVLVSDGAQGLNQAFVLGLADALRREGLEEIVPASYYSEAEKAIAVWEERFPQAYAEFSGLLAERGKTPQQLRRELSRHQEEGLAVFRELYPRVTRGSEFSPLLESEAVKLYPQVGEQLSKRYGYEGIYVVFDEFGKYIEGKENEAFVRDMKVVQDLCELAASSGQPQLYLTFVAHKSIREYGARLAKEKRNAFAGVEGRLKEVRFVVSSQNSYELIAQAVRKRPGAEEAIRARTAYFEIAGNSYGLPCFPALFSREEFERIVAVGCFPLLPLTAYLLLFLSEKVAQNERSVFTYLAGDEPGSLYRLLKEHGLPPEEAGVPADAVYLYFARLLEGAPPDSPMHNEWLKAEYALSKTRDEEERRVVRVMALLAMVERPEELPVDPKTVALAAGRSDEECRRVMDELVRRRIARYRERTNSYSFYRNVGVDVEEEIRQAALRLPQPLDYGRLLSAVSELDYVLPKRHNQQYTITRFFEYVFLTPEELAALSGVEALQAEHFADGTLAAVMETEEGYVPRLRPEAAGDERLVVLVPEKPFERKEALQRYAAIGRLLADPVFLEQNAVLRRELETLREELAGEINAALRQAYRPENGGCTVYHKGKPCGAEVWREQGFSEFLSGIADRCYAHSPKINNELINRQTVSPQIRRARDKVVNALLTGADMSRWERGTSAEATIYRSTLLATGLCGEGTPVDEGCRFLIGEIDRFLAHCCGLRTSFARLYREVTGPGCGVRRGVLPIYLAYRLSRLSDLPVLFFNGREVPLTAEMLDNVNERPAEYGLYLERETAGKEQYLSELWALFSPKARRAGNGQDRTGVLALEMQRWYRSLPQAALRFERRPDGMGQEEMETLCEVRRLLRRPELHPHELLFEELPALFGGEFPATVRGLADIRRVLDGYLDGLAEKAADVLRRLFGAKDGESLAAVLSDWYQGLPREVKLTVGGGRTAAFLRYVAELPTHGETEIAAQTAKLVLDRYLEDWADGTLAAYEQALVAIRREVLSVGAGNKGTSCAATKSGGNARTGTSGKEAPGRAVGADEGQKTAAGIDPDGRNRIVLEGGGGRLERYYEDREDSTAYFLENALEETMEEFGSSIESDEKVAALVRVLRRLLES